jgi:hypothetical protein
MGHLMLVTGYWCRKVITSRRQSDAIVDNVQTILGYTYTNLNVLIEAPNAPGSGMKMTVVRLVILKKKISLLLVLERQSLVCCMFKVRLPRDSDSSRSGKDEHENENDL